MLITELHYWYGCKGILPIVFFSLSILHNSIIKRKILNNYDKTHKCGVIGLGYVGLPLALAFAKKFTVVGYDNNSKELTIASRN